MHTKRLRNLCVGLLAGLLGLTACTEQEPLTVEHVEMCSMQRPSAALAEPETDRLLERYMADMTLEEKVGQLFFVTLGNLEQPDEETSNTQTVLSEAAISTLQSLSPGGVILMGGNIETDEQVTELNRMLQESARTPLLIGVDEEGGTVSRLGSAPGITMENVGTMREVGASGDSAEAYRIGVYLGTELNRLGFNMDFAPVADVLTNPQNSEIGVRAFGSDPDLTADMVTQEITGLQEQGVSAVAKHFPGHAGVSGNSHQSLQYENDSLEELRTEALVPFRAAIAADADAILTSHIVLTALEEDTPSSLSYAVVTGLLREELGYQGLVITDSFRMDSITEQYTQEEAAVLAIQAGADMILMPLSYRACYDGVLNAVRTGVLTEAQIDAACRRVLETKLKRGILTL